MLPLVETPPGHGVLAVEPDPDTAPYWQALGSGRLLLSRCLACTRLWAPPSANCPYCGARGHDWIAHDGRGRVYSWTVVHRALDDAFAGEAPYTIAVVTLDDADGARLLGRLLDPGPTPTAPAVEPQMPVQTVTYRIAGRTLPGFLPLSGTPTSEQKEAP